jgi:hypothetical protein
LLGLHQHAEPFDDSHFIMKTFEVYTTYDHVKHCTRITIINADTKHECIIYLDYIQHDKNLIFRAAKSIIDSGLLIM